VTVLSEEKDAGPSNPAGDNSSTGSVFSRLPLIPGIGVALLALPGLFWVRFCIPVLTTICSGYKTMVFLAALIWMSGQIPAYRAAGLLRGRIRAETGGGGKDTTPGLHRRLPEMPAPIKIITGR
jgi:hypothetical protein